MLFVNSYPIDFGKSLFSQENRDDPQMCVTPRSKIGEESSDAASMRRLRRIFASAQLALGKRMFTAGIDDNGLGDQIAAINQLLSDPAQLEDARITSLRIQRRRLFRQLADSALEFDAPLPGADDEFAEAFQAKRDLENVMSHSFSHDPMLVSA